MTDIVKVKVVVYEDGEEKHTLTVGYFHGQPYVVQIVTPDGVDRKYDGVALAASGGTGRV